MPPPGTSHRDGHTTIRRRSDGTVSRKEIIVTIACFLTLALAPVSTAATAEYDFPSVKRPGIDVRDDYWGVVSTVRIGRTYTVIPDLGPDTYSDPEIVYLCFKTRPSGRFKCDLAWATNLYEAAYPEGGSVTVSRKHVFEGRLWIRVLDAVDKRIIFKRSLSVR